MEKINDFQRINWLEQMANKVDGILLHNGTETGRLGIGLCSYTSKRTLRQAIDTAMESESI